MNDTPPQAATGEQGADAPRSPDARPPAPDRSAMLIVWLVVLIDLLGFGIG